MSNWDDRTRLLIGDEGIVKLNNSHVLVVGVGGVGGYAVEMLARAGVGQLSLVDGDTVDVSNINRQIIATHSTVGEYKCDRFMQRIADINPNCDIRTFNIRYNQETHAQIFDVSYDYVIDAIDSVRDKVELIKRCKSVNQRIISAMGAGNRINASDYQVVDIYTTCYDGLAKKMRKALREVGVLEHKVVATAAPAIVNASSEIASIAYMPPLCGIKLAAFVIYELIK